MLNDVEGVDGFEANNVKRAALFHFSIFLLRAFLKRLQPLFFLFSFSLFSRLSPPPQNRWRASSSCPNSRAPRGLHRAAVAEKEAAAAAAEGAGFPWPSPRPPSSRSRRFLPPRRRRSPLSPAPLRSAGPLRRLRRRPPRPRPGPVCSRRRGPLLPPPLLRRPASGRAGGEWGEKKKREKKEKEKTSRARSSTLFSFLKKEKTPLFFSSSLFRSLPILFTHQRFFSFSSSLS